MWCLPSQKRTPHRASSREDNALLSAIPCNDDRIIESSKEVPSDRRRGGRAWQGYDDLGGTWDEAVQTVGRGRAGIGWFWEFVHVLGLAEKEESVGRPSSAFFGRFLQLFIAFRNCHDFCHLPDTDVRHGGMIFSPVNG